MKKPFNIAGYIIEFESGTISVRDAIQLFAYLIRTGMAWSLQGSYGRAAAAIIEQGYITRAGTITAAGRALIHELDSMPQGGDSR